MAWLTDPVSGAYLVDPVTGYYLKDGPTNPLSHQAPVVSPTTGTTGQLITLTIGLWVGSNSVTRQWYRSNVGDEGGGSQAAIGGATGTTYTLTGSDVGKVVYCTETATNEDGSTSQRSNSVTYGAGGGSVAPLIYYRTLLAA